MVWRKVSPEERERIVKARTEAAGNVEALKRANAEIEERHEIEMLREKLRDEQREA